jgi:hypothetical protein
VMDRILGKLAVVASLPCLCIACEPLHSTRDASSDGGSDALTSDADDVERDSGADAIVDAESDSDADVEVEPELPRRGLVVLSERSFDDSVESSAIVRFGPRRHPTWCGNLLEIHGDCWLFRSNAPACEPDCAEHQACAWNEDCTVARCVERVDPRSRYDAGDISITGATHQPLVDCLLEDEGYACTLVSDMDFFEPGDELRVTAGGGTFPGFEAAVIAPSELEVTTDLASLAPDDLDGSRAISVEWDASEGAAAVEVSVVNSEARASLGCLSADDGHFEIPAEGLSALGEAASYELSVVRSNAAVINEGGDGEVKIYAESIGAELTIGDPS